MEKRQDNEDYDSDGNGSGLNKLFDYGLPQQEVQTDPISGPYAIGLQEARQDSRVCALNETITDPASEFKKPGGPKPMGSDGWCRARKLQSLSLAAFFQLKTT